MYRRLWICSEEPAAEDAEAGLGDDLLRDLCPKFFLVRMLASLLHDSAIDVPRCQLPEITVVQHGSCTV